MNIPMVDVTIHIDETLASLQQAQLENDIRSSKGVLGVGYHKNRAHLMMIEYNPELTSSTELLQLFTHKGMHAQMIGL